ncbi:MAG: hypothetical protein QOC55_842, partial [Thermoleophilaceae bacterium]|nr:hypothetical protein [Thermoleophilaceae bacterium]
MQYKRWQGPERPVANGFAATRLELETNDDAPGIARGAVEALGGQVDDDVLERTVLLASEVVTNAVRFSGGSELRFEMWRSGDGVAVVVSDDGPGFEPTPMATTIADADGDGGFGLPLLDTLSEAWGSGTGADSWVWFEVLPRIASRPLKAVVNETDELLDIRMVVESLRNQALVALDSAGRVTNWGAGPVALTGYAAEEMLGRPLFSLYVPSSADAFARDKDVAETAGSHTAERWIRRQGRPDLRAEVALAPIRDHSGRERGLSALISDMTARKREGDAREHLIVDLREQALTDALTGLANRRHFAQELARETARCTRDRTDFAVAVLDLDGFKQFNDTHGHPGGDHLLRTVTREWSAGLRASDLLGRLGGDEFAITLPVCPPALALAVVGRLQDRTRALIASSAGIASLRPGETGEQLLARADAALYEAKRG